MIGRAEKKAATKSLLLTTALAASICSAGSQAQANANTCEREMVRASSKYGVPLGMLYAVGLTETGRKGSLQPLGRKKDGTLILERDF